MGEGGSNKGDRGLRKAPLSLLHKYVFFSHFEQTSTGKDPCLKIPCDHQVMEGSVKNSSIFVIRETHASVDIIGFMTSNAGRTCTCQPLFGLTPLCYGGFVNE